MDTNKRINYLKFTSIIVSFIWGYLYADGFLMGNFFLGKNNYIISCICVAVYILWIELNAYRHRLMQTMEDSDKGSYSRFYWFEVRFWECILVLITICLRIGINYDLNLLAIHVVAIYLALCSFNRLFSKESSIFVFGDLINGAFRIPFMNIIGRVRAVIELVKDLLSVPKEETNNQTIAKSTDRNKYSKRVLGIVLSIIIITFALFILSIIVHTLTSLDSEFGKTMSLLFGWTDSININTEVVIVKFLWSIPCSAYIFGLIEGTVRRTRYYEDRIHNSIVTNISEPKVVPALIFYIIAAIYLTIYTVFLASQARYLFSAFGGILPSDYIMSAYAVDGFNDLIIIAIFNFIAIAVIRLFSSKSVKDSSLVAASCISLLSVNILFCLISASKTIMYIQRFSFTERRIDALWMTLVLLVGCALAIYNILRNRKTFAYWLWFAAGTYVIINMVGYFLVEHL